MGSSLGRQDGLLDPGTLLDLIYCRGYGDLRQDLGPGSRKHPVGEMREVLLGLQKAILPSAPELGEH